MTRAIKADGWVPQPGTKKKDHQERPMINATPDASIHQRPSFLFLSFVFFFPRFFFLVSFPFLSLPFLPSLFLLLFVCLSRNPS